MIRMTRNRDEGDEQPEGALPDTVLVAIVNLPAPAYECCSDRYDHAYLYAHGDAGDGVPAPAATA